METVTFNHFSDVWVGVPLVMSFMNHNVWLGEQYGCCLCCSLAVGVEYEMLVSRGRLRTHIADIAQYCLTPTTHFLVAGVIKEIVSWLRRTSCSSLATFSMKPS